MFKKTIVSLKGPAPKNSTHFAPAMPGLCMTIKKLEKECLELLFSATEGSDRSAILKEATEKKLLAKQYSADLTNAFINSVQKNKEY